jgi:hypothetical protein
MAGLLAHAHRLSRIAAVNALFSGLLHITFGTVAFKTRKFLEAAA